MKQYQYILVDVLNNALATHSLEELCQAYWQDHEDIILQALAIDYHYDTISHRFV